MGAFVDNLRLAFGAFLGNPLRSLLTLLGILIGVATVVSMMALIEGLRLKVTSDLSSLGADAFKASKWPSGFGRQDWRRFAKRPNFTLADRAAILETCPSVQAVAAFDDEGGQRIATATRETNPNVGVYGATPEYLATKGIAIASGRFLSDPDDADGQRVVVLGPDVSDLLFPGEDALGHEVRIRGRSFRVVGLLQRRGSFLGLFSMDNRVFLPLRAFKDLYGKKRDLELNVQAVDPSKLKQAVGEVRTLLRRRRHLGPGDEDNFELDTNDSMTKTFEQMSEVITAASFGVCVLSLLVGGIGILNIMLVSVTERTREIGIRKALGARRSRILAQFATEAVALSLSGGVIGVLLGYGLAFLVRWTLGFPTVVPAWAVGASLAMSSGVGLVFGIYPAARAAALDPVEAMRAE